MKVPGEELPLPGLSLGAEPSPGHDSAYSKATRLRQHSAAPRADLPAQGMRAEVPAQSLEPALLPGRAVLAPRAPLEGCPSPSPTAQHARGARGPCPGGTRAPAASQVRNARPFRIGCCVPAWSRSRIFSRPPCAIVRAATTRLGCHCGRRPAIAVTPAARRCAACEIVNPSGSGVGLWRDAPSGSTSIARPEAGRDNRLARPMGMGSRAALRATIAEASPVVVYGSLPGLPGSLGTFLHPGSPAHD